MQESSQPNVLLSDHVLTIVGLVATFIFGFASIFLVREPTDRIKAFVHRWASPIFFASLLLLTFSIAGALWRTSKSIAVAFFVLCLTTGFAIWRTLELRRKNVEIQNLNAAAKAAEQQRDVALAEEAEALQRAEQAVRERDLALAERDKAIAARKSYEIVARPRWEELKEIRYGHLEYKPFLLYDLNQLAVGLGVDLLEQLFTYPVSGGAVHLEPDGDPRDWTTIFDDLIAGVFDVVATPLFATYERSQRVGFSAPLFFSNVGLYMKETVANDGRWKNITAGEMRKRLRNANVFKLLAIKGEISKSLADGVFEAWNDGQDPAMPQQSSNGCIEPRPSTTRLPNLLQTIATSENPPYALFCESFTAELQPVVASGKVINVLRDHEILYPVCFAVRHGDYQLRNLLNIRLMDFSRSIDGGVLKLLEDNLPKYGYKDTTPAFMRKHFVERWPPPPPSPPANGSLHAEAQV